MRDYIQFIGDIKGRHPMHRGYYWKNIGITWGIIFTMIGLVVGMVRVFGQTHPFPALTACVMLVFIVAVAPSVSIATIGRIEDAGHSVTSLAVSFVMFLGGWLIMNVDDNTGAFIMTLSFFPIAYTLYICLQDTKKRTTL